MRRFCLPAVAGALIGLLAGCSGSSSTSARPTTTMTSPKAAGDAAPGGRGTAAPEKPAPPP